MARTTLRAKGQLTLPMTFAGQRTLRRATFLDAETYS